MARRGMGKEIDKVVDREAGVEVKIYLEKSSMIFSGSVFGETFSGKDGQKVKREIKEAICKSTVIDWQLVIVVNELHPWHHDGPMLGISKEREWFGKRSDGKWLACPYAEKTIGESRKVIPFKPSITNSRIAFGGEGNDKFKIPMVTEGRFTNDPVYYLPHTLALWAALGEVEEGIKKLRNKFREILGDPDQVKKLEAAGAKILGRMLTKGEKEKS